MKNLFILTVSLSFCIAVAHAAPNGKIGFLGSQGAQVWNLQTKRTVTIPHGHPAENLSVSPQGVAVFFTPNGRLNKNSEKLSNGFISRPPYRQALAIPKLQSVAPYRVTWSSTGNSLYLNGTDWNRVYTPATGKVSALGFKPSGFDGPAGFDAKGKWVSFCTETEAIVRNVETGKNRVIFSTNNPKPVFDALRRAQNPKNVSDLLSGEEMLKEEPKRAYSPWQLSGPVLSPDGSRAYFSTNCGTGFGAAGNGMQGYFSSNLKTGVISVMSKVGPSFGRPPEMTISPDGKRLLAVSSVHSSAADNSCVAIIIDLETQKYREIMYSIPGSKDKANFYGGSAWSPDGKYIALSAYFYDPEKAMTDMSNSGDWEETPPSAWKTAIFNASNGKIWGIKQGARSPSWAR